MKNNKIYNVVFPIWFLLLFPLAWLIVMPVNFLIDSIVICLALKFLKTDDILQRYKEVIVRVFLFGFLADFIGSVFLLAFTILVGRLEENVKLLSKLKEKYNLYILSNFHQPAFEHIFKKYEFFRLFDGHTVSCYYYLLKPEKEIYDTLINKFNLIPKETVFIDDTKVNIDACEKEGIRGIHLPDYTELKQKLEEFLK